MLKNTQDVESQTTQLNPTNTPLIHDMSMTQQIRDKKSHFSGGQIVVATNTVYVNSYTQWE
jgi:hypothetical protein